MHFCLKFHVLIGVGSPQIGGVSRKRVQLSRGNLLSDQKGVATKVINQVCQPDIERGALNAYGTHRQTVHGRGHKSEYVFDTTTDLGLSAVILLLFIGQGLVAIAFSANFITDVFG